MPRKEIDLSVEAAGDGGFVVVWNGRSHRLRRGGAFVLGYRLWRLGQAAAAARVFETIHAARPSRRAAILLARCRAALKDYAGSDRILRELFPSPLGPLAEGLQSAFVFDDVGMPREAVRELAKIVRDRPELSTACLLLGDLFAALGQRDQAGGCWRLAAARDGRRGMVARAARLQLDAFERPSEN